MLRLAGAAILMAFSLMGFSGPAYAADWYYVTNATDYANISFIDKDGIREDDAGITHASMFSLLAVAEDDGVIAYRFELQVKCRSRESRLVAATTYDGTRTSRGEEAMTTDWDATEAGTQGETVTDYICSKGKSGTAASSGKQLPFDAGRTMLADLAKAGAK
jgi:hypothetical protein